MNELELRLERHIRAIASTPHNLGQPAALEAAAQYIEADLAASGLEPQAQIFEVDGARSLARATHGPALLVAGDGSAWPELARVLPALKEYQTFLEKKLPKSTGEWRLGKEKFAKKLVYELDAVGSRLDQEQGRKALLTVDRDRHHDWDGRRHAYRLYEVQNGNHIESYVNFYPQLVVIQPHAQKAFDLLVDNVEGNVPLPPSQCIPKGGAISASPAQPGHCASLFVP